MSIAWRPQQDYKVPPCSTSQDYKTSFYLNYPYPASHPTDFSTCAVDARFRDSHPPGARVTLSLLARYH